uniref:Uncharacterized protein n=1 Tax=Brassica oleracea TaxID=3712 RepID=A0A3P6G590_BRAOL|nr:unnamed protein product [Brassica oleracea]
MYCCIMHGRPCKWIEGKIERTVSIATDCCDKHVYDEFDMVLYQDDSGKSTDTGHLIDKLHGLGSFRPPSTTALSLLLLNILISSRTWLVVPPRMIVLFLSLTPPLVVSKLGKYNEIIREVNLKKSTSPSGLQISPSWVVWSLESCICGATLWMRAL